MENLDSSQTLLSSLSLIEQDDSWLEPPRSGGQPPWARGESVARRGGTEASQIDQESTQMPRITPWSEDWLVTERNRKLTSCDGRCQNLSG